LADWNMLTLVGEDRPGIVARVTQAIFEAGGSLGEASMIRLGGNFTIMLMAAVAGGEERLQQALAPVVADLGLCLHIDAIGGGLHQHLTPNIQVRVAGADRAGIVADVTGALAREGFNILELESDVGGDPRRPFYLMNIQGYADCPIETLQAAVASLVAGGISVDISAVETLIG
jgi:glycine cleavage system transcriptional repressor